MGKLYQTNSRIISKKQISERHFLLTFNDEKIADKSFPGQFVMIKIDNGKTFLRRPFSICSVNRKTFDIIFKVVGVGTKILSEKKVDDVVSIIGPLGNGFPLSPIAYPLFPIIVAGGTGVASLLFLANHLSTYQPVIQSIVVFIGAKTKKDVLFKSEFKKLGCKVIVSTEDGSYGSKGLVSDIFTDHLTIQPSNHLITVYACGPKPMLKKIAETCNKKKIKCYVSLEEQMACGVGACMGCIVKVKGERLKVKNKGFEYKRVCKDGPVFVSEEIVW